MHRALRPDQIAATLKRFGLPEGTEILGIRYEARQVLVAVEGAILAVPADVLTTPSPEADQSRPTIFDRPVEGGLVE